MKFLSLFLFLPLLICGLLLGNAALTELVYDSSKTYSKGDAVIPSSTEFTLYTAKTTVPAGENGPPNTAYWQTAEEYSTELQNTYSGTVSTPPSSDNINTGEISNLGTPDTNTPSSQNAKIVSVNVRGTIGEGNDKRIMGFRMNGPADVLLRGVGPALADFGIPASTLLPDPKITLLRYINGDSAQGSERVTEGDNDNYSSNSNAIEIETVRASYALDIPTNTSQAISMPSLTQGFYTSQVEDVNGQTGIGWAGVDLSYPDQTSTSFLHVSARGIVETTEYMFGGFQITGSGTRKLYIRGRGPSLADFGVPGVMPDPLLKVFKYDDDTFTSSTLIAENDDYTSNSNASDILSYSSSLYNWPAIKEKGAAMILDLGPGYYTVQLISTSTSNDGNGWIGVDDVTE
jgi:hypothetical protein